MNFNSVFEELNKLYEDATVENYEDELGRKAWSKNAMGYYDQAAKELGLTNFSMQMVKKNGEDCAIISATKDGKNLSAEEAFVQETHNVRNVEDAKSYINYVFGLDESLTEATIYTTKAKMAQLDKAVEDAQKEVAKYKIPMKRNSAGESEPDFDAVPENQREAAKVAYDRYQKALAARPSRSQNIIKYTDDMDESCATKQGDVKEGILGTALAAGAGALVGSALGGGLGEAVEDDMEEPVEEASTEEPEEVEVRHLILECSKCGAIVIKDEVDVVVDEESDLVNVEDECEYCEEKEGYKIIGVVAPYEIAEEEPVEESLDKDKLEELLDANISADLRNFGGTGNKVSVLSGGLPEELEKKDLSEEDEDLDELFNANIKLDARGFGGSGNDVGIL